MPGSYFARAPAPARSQMYSITCPRPPATLACKWTEIKMDIDINFDLIEFPFWISILISVLKKSLKSKNNFGIAVISIFQPWIIGMNITPAEGQRTCVHWRRQFWRVPRAPYWAWTATTFSTRGALRWFVLGWLSMVSTRSSDVLVALVLMNRKDEAEALCFVKLNILYTVSSSRGTWTR